MVTMLHGILVFSSDAWQAKWELKYYWEDGVTIECRYFATRNDASEFAKYEGYPRGSFKIIRNK